MNQECSLVIMFAHNESKDPDYIYSGEPLLGFIYQVGGIHKLCQAKFEVDI